MKRALQMVVAVAVSGASLRIAAQQRPNFSGEWANTPEQAAGRGGPTVGTMGSGWGSPLTITQTESVLTVQYEFFARGDLQPPLSFRFALDGSETINTVMMGRGTQKQQSTAKWNGNTLVITTKHDFAHPTTGAPTVSETRQALTLQSPTTLLVETTRVGVLGGPTSASKTVLTKR
ncbi:MAG: hypothetical protein IPP90_21825 [Gemmatimonadaceae bacterium]|nr:hypothetical protein [Gemmatimonadaceae bacterium]